MAEEGDTMLGKRDESLSFFDTRTGAGVETRTGAGSDKKHVSRGGRQSPPRGAKGAAMNDVMRAQRLLHEAFPDLTHEGRGRVQLALYQAWTFLRPLIEPAIDRKYTLRRVRALHEGQAKRIDGAELEALELAKIEGARRERDQLRRRLENLERELAAMDADLARGPAAAFRHTTDGQGRAAAR